MISMRLLEQSVAGSTVESTFSAPNAPQNGPPVVWCQVIFFSFFLKATRTRQETLKFIAQNAPAFAAAG